MKPDLINSQCEEHALMIKNSEKQTKRFEMVFPKMQII